MSWNTKERKVSLCTFNRDSSDGIKWHSSRLICLATSFFKLFFFLSFSSVSWQKKMYSKFQEILPLLQRLQYYWQQKSSFLKVIINVFKIALGSSESTPAFVQHNIGFIKYNSRTNIDMPACFLTKMAALKKPKNDGSEIEEKQNCRFI